MRKFLRTYVLGVLSTVIIVSGVSFAKTGSNWIEAFYSDIKIYVDGIKIEPKDANGGKVEPFICNGTTYLPVRAIGEALDKQVQWDGSTNSIFIGKKTGDIQSFIEICPPYDGEKYEVHKASDGKYITIAGERYTNALTLGNGGGFAGEKVRGSALFNLNAQYEKLSFDIGRTDLSTKKDTILNIYLDGQLQKSYEVAAEELPKKMNVNLNKALQMKIEIIGKGGQYGIINAEIE